MATYTQFFAGASTVDIVPNQTTIRDLYLGGYGSYRSRKAEGVLDTVSVRALVIDIVNRPESAGFNGSVLPKRPGAGPVILASVDTIGLGSRTVTRIREETTRHINIHPSHILISATHTHSGPDLQGLWGGVSSAYHDFVISGAARAIVQAWRSRQPATLHVASASLTGFNRNRRTGGHADHALTVAQFRASDDTTIATWANFAAHPVIIGGDNKALSTDYVGALVREMEALCGGTGLFFMGNIGDASPLRPDMDNAVERAETYGRRLARAIVQTLGGADEISPRIMTRVHPVTFEVKNEEFLQAFHSGLLTPYFHIVQRQKGFSVETEMVRIRFGTENRGLELLSVPGEPLTRLGATLGQFIGETHHMILGLTPEALGYFVPHDEWMTGPRAGYEESRAIEPKAAEKVMRAAAGLFSATS